jgi:formylglycine-generating enzyme required for sulfatase activity
MVFVEGGTFMMGCDPKDKKTRKLCEDDEQPVHEVTLSDFYIGKYEVTNEEFAVFLNEMGNQEEGGTKWLTLDCGIHFVDGKFQPILSKEDHPVNCVSWYGARAYCLWISKKANDSIRLPSEAEWEYAARGGQEGLQNNYLYAGSDNLDEVAWYGLNSGGGTKPIGVKKANELGLHDMSGNVWEWCADFGNDNYNNAPADGSAWQTGDSYSRMVRGGCWSYNVGRLLSVFYRFEIFVSAKGGVYDGFRLAQDPPEAAGK